MPNAVFVAPFLLDTTARFVDAVASLPGVRCALVTQEPDAKVPVALRDKLAGHYRVDDCIDAGQIAHGVRAVGAHLGSVDRLVGTLEQIQVQLAQVREALGIEGMGVETAHNFRDKARMKEVLAAAGLPCARHRLAHSAEEAWGFVHEVGLPVVVKPPAGAGAINTFQVGTEDEVRDWLATAPPTHGVPTQVEEFVTGEEHSFDSVCVDGRVVWHSVSRYLPSPLEVLRNPWIQWVVLLPRDIDGPEYDGIRHVAPASLAALGMRTGLSHMEWFRRPDGSVAVSEVAARPPGAQITTLLSYAHDIDLYSAWARLMVYDSFDPPERRHAVGAAFLRGQGRGRIKAVHGLEAAQREVGDLVIEARLPSPGAEPSPSYEGDGYVIVRHHDTGVVEEALRRLIGTIEVEVG